ncbi:MAG: porin [Zoogloeaceae bacterium]|jgi:predicted porin|nr:porin [Zoogloeaceae bacterium]
MQQKLIVLAVAAFASAAAFAQTNRPASSQQQQQRPAASQQQPQRPAQAASAAPGKPLFSLYGTDLSLYGVLDGGVSYRMASGMDNALTVDSGISEDNRLGVNAVRDLGNGLSLLGTLEIGFALDVDSDEGKDIWGRQAFVGLAGGFGKVVTGTLFTPHYTFVSDIDPFQAGTVGSYRNIFNTGSSSSADDFLAKYCKTLANIEDDPDDLPEQCKNVGESQGANLFDPDRMDNAIAYTSPNFSGFTITGAYSAKISGHDAGTSKDYKMLALAPRYTSGPLDIGLSFYTITEADVTNITLGGTIDTGPIKLHAFASHNQQDSNKTDNFMLGLTIPFDKKHAAQTSFNYGRSDGGGNAWQFAFGYTYNFDEQASFYAALAKADNVVVADNRADTGRAYDSGVGIQAGLKYKF